MKDKISRVLGIVRRFGSAGIHYLLMDKLNSLKIIRGNVALRVPGLRHPLHLRTGTSDFKLFRNIFIDGEYDISLPFSPSTIIDGGANIGLAAIVFANRYPNAQIVCIEPESSNFAMLKQNTARYPNVSVIQGGVWRNSSYLNIINPQSGKWAFMIEESDTPAASSIRGMSIDDIIMSNGWERADLIKLDVEGSEKEIFEQGTDNWLGKAKAVIIEFHDWLKPLCTETVMNAIKPFNFRRSTKGENVVLIREDLVSAS